MTSRIFKAESQYKAFILSLAVFGLAYGLYKAVLDNYLAEIVSMSQFDRGVSEFFRELPGFMLVFVLALLYEFSAEKIFKAGAVIMLAGMAMQSVIPASRFLVTCAVFVYSLGEHMQYGMRRPSRLSTPETAGEARHSACKIPRISSGHWPGISLWRSCSDSWPGK